MRPTYAQLCWGFILSVLFLLTGCKQKGENVETEAFSSKYHVGQEWSYKTRPQDSGSTFTIVKIDDGGKLGAIVHISVQGLKMKTPHVSGGFTTTFPHLPMAEAAIDKSAVKLINENATLPDYAEGYKEWRRAFDAHEAGIFTISVRDCIDVAEKALVGSNPSPSPMQQLLSKYDDFLTAELAHIRDATENQSNAQGEHTELFYNLVAGLSKTKGANFIQAMDTVYDFLSRCAPEIRLPQSFDAGPAQMKRMREKMAVYTVDEARREIPAKKWWQFWR